MKVLLINGSPHEKGCTNAALGAIADVLREAGMESEIIYLASESIPNYIAPCCDFKKADEVLEKAKTADGFVFGSPVHYAGMSSVLKTFLDYFFWMCGDSARNKPAAAFVSGRRGGATAALSSIYEFFGNAGMPIVSAQGWHVVHGNTPEEVAQDQEGLHNLRVMAKNIVWLLRCIEAGRAAGIDAPAKETKPKTNFIRYSGLA
jgi:multimeric flavodoxin WrbA